MTSALVERQRHAAGVSGRWVEVGDGVLVRRHEELDLSTGLVVGEGACLVIDTGGDARQGAELAAAVRAVTPHPWTVALTHAHFDHCFGTPAFLPCERWAHTGCPPALATTAEPQRAEWVAHYRDAGRDEVADALATSPVVPPDRLVDASVSLRVGGRLVLLAHLGRGHTDHDLVVQVPDAGVVFAGDLVEQGAPPDFSDAHPVDWPATLNALLGLGAGRVVPGHGEPVDAGFVSAQRDELAAVAALCEAVAAGALDETSALTRSPYPPAETRIALRRC